MRADAGLRRRHVLLHLVAVGLILVAVGCSNRGDGECGETLETGIRFVSWPGPRLSVMSADGRCVFDVVAHFEGVDAPAFSPSGEFVAFSRHDRDGSSDATIYVMRIDGSERRSISPAGGSNISPRWSPDGASILFSRRGVSPPDETYVFTVDTGEVAKVANGNDPRWSADGSRIAFESYSGVSSQVVTMNLDGSERRVVTEGFGPVWSPDGGRIAFGRFARVDGDSRYQIFVVNADGSGEVPLGDGDPYGLAWSPDGEAVSFFSAPFTRQPSGVYIVRVDGGAPAQFIGIDGWPSDGITWAADGSMFAFTGYGPDSEPRIFVLDTDGAIQRRAPNDSADGERHPSWFGAIAEGD